MDNLHNQAVVVSTVYGRANVSSMMLINPNTPFIL